MNFTPVLSGRTVNLMPFKQNEPRGSYRLGSIFWHDDRWLGLRSIDSVNKSASVALVFAGDYGCFCNREKTGCLGTWFLIVMPMLVFFFTSFSVWKCGTEGPVLGRKPEGLFCHCHACDLASKSLGLWGVCETKGADFWGPCQLLSGVSFRC